MQSFITHFKKLDWILIISVLLLVAIGLLSIYSSSFGKGDFLNFKKQIVFLLISFFLMIVLSFLNWRVLRDEPYLILILYFISLLGLLGLFFLAPEIRGTKSWYKIGEISINPIEFTKIILIILLAKYFSTRHIEMYRIRHIILSGIYVFLPAILIFFQPDLGSILILMVLWVTILVISGIKLRHFLLLVLLGLVILILTWLFLLHPYQKERIIGFISPQLEPLGVSWSQAQSKIAIGSGGIWGQGFKQGSQTQYGFLPEPQTDFIFAAIGEEFGLMGISVILFLFSILFWRIIKVAIISKTNFPRLFASGLGILLVLQLFINIGMNLGILPIIGIPLPLVSYGGSNLIVIFSALGILENIKIQS